MNPNPKPNEVKEKPEGDSGKRKTVSCLTLTLTLIGKIVQKIRFKETERGKEGEKGGSVHLAVEHAGARGKERAGRG